MNALSPLDHEMIAVAKQRGPVVVRRDNVQQLAHLVAWRPKRIRSNGKFTRRNIARVQFRTGTPVSVPLDQVSLPEQAVAS